jgi:hypothetical protein
MADDIKQELISKIESTNDADLLMLLKTDYEYFTHEGDLDVTNELSEEDKSELINMVSEPFGHDTISQRELDEVIMQWRMK